VEEGEERARCRVPNSGDIVALAGVKDRATAARHLLRRCVLDAQRGGVVVPPSSVSDELLSALSMRIAHEDPLAVIRFDVECPTFGGAIAAGLDMVGDLWGEITAQAKRVARAGMGWAGSGPRAAEL